VDLNLEPQPENPAQKRKIAMSLAFVSAAMILATLFTHGWLRAAGGIDAGFGLMSLQACEEGSCKSISNKEMIDEHNTMVKKAKELSASYADMGRDMGLSERDLEEKSAIFWIMGYATLLFALLAAASLVVAGVTLGQGKLMIQPIAPTSTAMLFLFLSLVTACIFVATNPTRGTGMQLGVGWAFWTFGIGTVVGILAVPMILKFKPVEPDHFQV